MKKVSIVLLLLLLLSTIACREEEENLNVSSKEELEEKLKEEFEINELVSVSYCVVKNDQILQSGALGLADIDNNRSATDNTRYLVASVSKTITAVAAMKLVEQNLIGLDDDVNQYLPFPVRNPNFPDDKITLRMLLNHRSGISDDFQEILDLYCYSEDCAMSLAEYCNEVFVEPGAYYSVNNFSDNKPGEIEDYSNLAYALIGYLVEGISMTPFDEYCKSNIFHRWK